MRVVVALGGNALLRRGQALSAENQRENARAACAALAPLALEHELVVSHGNGPQVGLLALQGSAYTAVDTYPLDVLGAQTEGMIGYMLEQELGNELPFERHLATLLTMIEVDADDPAFQRPTKPIGPIYDAEEAARLEREKGWAFMADGDSMRRAVPSPAPKRIFGIHVIRIAARPGRRRDLRRRRRDPDHLHRRARARRPPAERRRGGDRQGPGERAAGDRDRRRRAADRHRRRRRLRGLGHARSSGRSAARRRRSSAPRKFAAGSMGPKVRAACWFAERTGRFAAIGSIADTQALLRGEAGTRVAVETAVPTG